MFKNYIISSLFFTILFFNLNAEVQYSITEIQAPKNIDEIIPKSLNDNGTVAGEIELYNSDPERIGGDVYPFIWNAQTGLEILDIAEHFNLRGMNNSEEVIGSGDFWNKESGLQPIMLDDSRQATDVFAINNAGQVIASYFEYDEDFDSEETNDIKEFYLWDKSKTVEKIELGIDLSRTSVMPVDINDQKQVLFMRMNFDEIPCDKSDFFVWQDGKIIDSFASFKRLPNNHLILPVKINNNGDVLAMIVHETGSPDDFKMAKLYTQNQEIEIKADAGLALVPNSMNNAGQIVGSIGTMEPDFYSEDSRAFIWDAQNEIQDLNYLIKPFTGWILRTALVINNKGQILGEGLKNGSRTIFLLTPLEK